MNDRVEIKGIVTAWQEDEDGNREIVIDHKENSFVDQGLKMLLSYLLGDNVRNDTTTYYKAQSWAFKIYLGSDTTTSTTHNLTALASPIGTAPGTAPNITSGEDRSNPSTGVWKAGWIGQWNPGTVTGTVGELALYFNAFSTITANWAGYGGNGEPSVMISRLCKADSDFTQVTIDSSKSFVVHWELQVSFT